MDSYLTVEARSKVKVPKGTFDLGELFVISNAKLTVIHFDEGVGCSSSGGILIPGLGVARE